MGIVQIPFLELSIAYQSSSLRSDGEQQAQDGQRQKSHFVHGKVSFSFGRFFLHWYFFTRPPLLLPTQAGRKEEESVLCGVLHGWHSQARGS